MYWTFNVEYKDVGGEGKFKKNYTNVKKTMPGDVVNLDYATEADPL